LLNLMKLPIAQTFAARGLERLAPADFRKDCRLVLDSKSGLSGLFQDTVRALRDLPPDDVEALAALLPQQGAAFLHRAVTQLSATRDRPLSDTLKPLLNELWGVGLRESVERALRSVAGEAAVMVAREQPYNEGRKLYEAKDYAAAAQSFQAAAALGHPASQFILGQLFDQGVGVGHDNEAALRWYLRAGTNGVIDAQMTLGNRYLLGTDGPADPLEAYFWYGLAAQAGKKPAETFRNLARRKLTPDQLAEGNRRLALVVPGTTNSPPSKATEPHP
jgi:hypothetical protein